MHIVSNEILDNAPQNNALRFLVHFIFMKYCYFTGKVKVPTTFKSLKVHGNDLLIVIQYNAGKSFTWIEGTVTKYVVNCKVTQKLLRIFQEIPLSTSSPYIQNTTYTSDNAFRQLN